MIQPIEPLFAWGHRASIDPQDVSGILYRNKGWIHSRDLAAMVGRKDDRFLRGEDSPIRTCAISGNNGIKHILHATDEEFAEFYARLRSHALKELKHIRKLRASRTSTKQGVMLV